MKNILSFFKHVATPSLFYIFIILGLTAAAISGLIECIVIREFLSGVDFKGSRYIPVIIVIILEGLKLFLHYAIPTHEKIKDYHRLHAKKIVKYALVIFSLLCTIVYSSTAMYQPQAVSKAIATQTTEVSSNLQKELDKEVLKIETDSQLKLQKAENEVISITEELKQLDPVYKPVSAYNRYISEKQRLEENLSKAQGAYERQVEAITKERDNKISNIKKRYESMLKNQSLKAEEELSGAGDNVYLSSALLFFASLFGAKSYSRVFYFLCVLIISIVVSTALEFAIAFSQAYLSLNSDTLNQLFGSAEDNLTNKAIKNKAIMTVKIIVQAAIMLSICLIYAAFTETIITDKSIFFAFFELFCINFFDIKSIHYTRRS